jgi:glutamyl-tRNA(Gln) amidotransferase subunit E
LRNSLKIPLFFAKSIYIPVDMDNFNINIRDNALFESLGFKCGLEIHQQVATEKKLFCHCPVGLTNHKHDAEILRHMRPTLSELGEYDGTALMEFKTKKEVIYRLYRDRTCTYEMDDTPPFMVNQQAIDYAIRLAQLFKCRIVDEIHVIRKQYLDGSIPTGFQRTMIIGIDGWIPYKDRKVLVTQVNLEEEACREVSDIGHRITYATDRLSTPLVEIITDSSIKNPTEAAEVCRILGNAMKVTGLVRRGIGTVRQDVNVSVTGGTRVEIKGVHRVRNIVPLTAFEALRQKGLLELKNIFCRRFSSPAEIPYKESNLTVRFSGTKNSIGHRLESDRPLKVVALHLPNLIDIIKYPLQPNWNFGSELAGRVRVIACIDTKPNLFFYSQKEKYDIPDSDWDEIRLEYKAGPNDDTILICGPSADIVTAINEIKIRIAELAIGVVNETRQDMKNGTTDFERILPGPDRMYPDTDHPPVMITRERVAENLKLGTEPLWERQKRWQTAGLHQEQINALSLSPYSGLFDRLITEKHINLRRAAHTLTDILTDLRRAGYTIEPEQSEPLFDLVRESLQKDWPYRKLKISLQALADSQPRPDISSPIISDISFDSAWEEIEKLYIGFKDDNYHYKFRRFAIGSLFHKFPGERKSILTRVEQKLPQ